MHTHIVCLKSLSLPIQMSISLHQAELKLTSTVKVFVLLNNSISSFTQYLHAWATPVWHELGDFMPPKWGISELHSKEGMWFKNSITYNCFGFFGNHNVL